ncbi:carbohydrate sulfotransferase 11-like isoform X2 [Mizuhopecten yessoensis]|nr:carbohydrate sulfotransferase 11-like isoform X2 [Mizuhopecten yessoensis]
MAPKSSLSAHASAELVSRARLKKLSTMCWKYRSIMQQKNWNMILDGKLHVGFCPIQKVGSTFWRRVLEYCGGRRRYTSVFEVKWQDMKTPHVQKYRDRGPSLLESSIKFMFVRNPYQRLFSGWVDKLLSPNPIFWEKVGVRVNEFLNQKSTFDCGHDVTFAEFVKYFIHTQQTKSGRDPHFIPMYEHCSPCHHKFDFIGTMETFNKDAAYLMEIISNRSHVNISIEDMKGAGYDSLNDHTMRLYRFKPDTLKCVSFHNAMQRSWRNLQIRGYLGKNVSLPFTRVEAGSVKRNTFLSALVTAYESSGSKSYRRANRREAMMEAYGTVCTDDLERLRQIFKLDWILFGYNDRPIEIFELSRHYNKSFSFFDVEE